MVLGSILCGLTLGSSDQATLLLKSLTRSLRMQRQ